MCLNGSLFHSFYVEIQNALNDEDLNLTPNELLLLTEAGFANELLTMFNKYRACQCVMTHVVFKTRREEIDQLRKGMDSISLISFLQSCEGCLPYIFPLTDELKITADDFLDLIPISCFSEMTDGKKNMDWFIQYVKDVAENKRGTYLYLKFDTMYMYSIFIFLM